jgi:hypothetical protein
MSVVSRCYPEGNSAVKLDINAAAGSPRCPVFFFWKVEIFPDMFCCSHICLKRQTEALIAKR